MKPMLTAFAATALIAVGAYFALNEVAPFSSADRQSGDAVRLD